MGQRAPPSGLTLPHTKPTITEASHLTLKGAMCVGCRAGRYIEYVRCIVIFFETIWNEAIPFISIQ